MVWEGVGSDEVARAAATTRGAEAGSGASDNTAAGNRAPAAVATLASARTRCTIANTSGTTTTTASGPATSHCRLADLPGAFTNSRNMRALASLSSPGRSPEK